jgi:hypothetical protein
MKRLLLLLALGVAAGALTRWSATPLESLPATPEAWPPR